MKAITPASPPVQRRGHHGCAMYCRRCKYPLRQIPPPVCPECGGLFDPADPSTFLRSPSERWEIAGSIVTIAIVGATIGGAIVAAMCVFVH